MTWFEFKSSRKTPLAKKAERKPAGKPPVSVASKGSFVVIEVGPKRIKYSVHKSLLEQESQYFRAALNGRWKEADEQVIKLVDMEPNIFSIFVNWLYTGKLPKTSPGWIDFDNGPYPKAQKGYTVWSPTALLAQVTALIFGDRFLASNFSVAVNNAFVDSTLSMPYTYLAPTYEVIILAFGNLPSASPVLQLLVDTHCCANENLDQKGRNKALRSQLPQEFLLRVMEKHREMIMKTGGPDRTLYFDTYYQNASGDRSHGSNKRYTIGCSPSSLGDLIRVGRFKGIESSK